MANIRSSKKRAFLSVKRNIINSQQRARIRNQIKTCELAIKNKDKQKEIILNKTISTLAKMAQKKILHYKTANRKISQLQKQYNVLSK